MRIRLKAVWWTVFVFLGLALVGTSTWGGEAVVLNDTELDQVYGGRPSEEDDDSLAPLRSHGRNSLIIRGSAQANASSVITVNAVSSVVGAQVNVIANMGTIRYATQVNNGGFVTGP